MIAVLRVLARFGVLRLTDEGLKKIVEAAPGHVETVQNLVFDRLSPAQVRQLTKLCETLLEDPAPAPDRTTAG